MRRVWVFLSCTVGLALGVATASIAIRASRASSLLSELAAPAEAAGRDATPRQLELRLPSGSRARHYFAQHRRRSVVLVHGVHHLGIDEPRLMAFAQRLAKQGVEVFTPELPDLKNYALSERALTGLSEAVDHFVRERGAHQPGLIGLSFAGGLALVAASDPALAAKLSYVASIGGHHNLARVLRFFISNRVDSPAGLVSQQAHEYGLVLLTYTHLSRLVPQQDVATLRASFRAWLAEDRATARARAVERNSLEAERVWLLLEEQRLNELSVELGRALLEDGPRLESLSPSGKLSRVQLPVFVLHGRGDTVIPASEADWTELELRQARGDNWNWPTPLGSGSVLVTPLLDHVSLGQSTHVLDELRLLGFWAQLL